MLGVSAGRLAEQLISATKSEMIFSTKRRTAMLRSIKFLSDYDIHAKDGDIGAVKEFLFDKDSWVTRYLVVDTGNWLSGRKVLISPMSIGKPNPDEKKLPLSLTRDQIKRSPVFDMDRPISHKYLGDLYKHYGWSQHPVSCGCSSVHPSRPSSMEAERGRTAVLEAEDEQESALNLLNTKQVMDYSIHAIDGDIGHVEDFIVDDEGWIIRYMAVDTSKWLPGSKKVLISPSWIKTINGEKKMVSLDITKESLKNSPPYDPSASINREYEAKFYDYYGRKKYWE